jgi:hypothetical protein
MEARKEDGFWKSVNKKVKWVFEELKKDSVAQNPGKPVDCCNPPVPRKITKKQKSS